MGFADWLREHHIYLVMLALLASFGYILFSFSTGEMNYESARVYVQALTGIATLALLYYAYFNVVSKKEEDTARLELAVRPILVWELESRNGGADLVYKTIKHPIYDMHVLLTMGGKQHSFNDRHLDVFEAHAGSQRRHDVSGFISECMGRQKAQLLHITFAYHSEVGGKYEFSFTKEVVKKPHGFGFQHRKIVYAKYPWRKEKVDFSD